MSKTSIRLNRILFIRLDRIGDLVLTLPVDQAFAPSTYVKWWIPRGLSFITQAARPRRSAVEVGKTISLKNFLKTVRVLRRENFDAAVVFHAPWWVSLALCLAGIPVRAGVKSQWHSFFFLNRAIRQKRSRAEASELEYNYRLVEEALGMALPRETLRLHGLEDLERIELLRRWNLSPFQYLVIHPGMGGSALNWPVEKYVDFIRSASESGQVAITGTRTDEPYLAPIRQALSDASVLWLDGKLSGLELITILENSRAIIAPSTGVMHLAASTQRPTLGLFSPVRVQHPKRWGPQGSRAVTLVPRVECPGEMSCLGEACTHYDCMATISGDQISAALSTFEESNDDSTEDSPGGSPEEK